LQNQRILIISPHWLGDAVMSHSLIRALPKNLKISVLCPLWLKPIYQRIAEVNDIYPLDLQHGKFQLSLYLKTAKKIKGKFDKAIIIPRKFKAALIPYFAKIPIRSGTSANIRNFFINDIKNIPHDKNTPWLEKTLKLINYKQKPPYPKLQIDPNNQQKWQQKIKTKKLIAFMPGASYGKTKQYPANKFASLATVLQKKGYEIIILGGKNEKLICDKICKNNDNILNLSGKTTIFDAIDILDLCQYAITNDSGLMHISSAVNCHPIVIYGGSSPFYTPPLTNNKTILQTNLECQPCFKRFCPLKSYECLEKITAEQICQNIS